MKKHNFKTLYSGLVIGWNNTLMRASWHGELNKAIEHAQTHRGIVAIEEIGKGIVWKREEL